MIFTSGSILANAAVVPAGTGGGINVYVNFSIAVIIEINEYYAGTGVVTAVNALSGDVTLAAGGITSSMIASGAVGLSQIDSSQVQARIAQTCPAGSAIQTIYQDGAVVCTASSSQTPFSLSAADSAGHVGSDTSITTGLDGLGLISCYDVTNQVLKVAHCSNVLCTPYVRRR